ncbi:MAG: M64 family metallo-endopeptidase [Bacteroidaceae bacterium]|nr:M64 family metallo-endopeptidase [Bacteroidaceae bacterium]
MKKATLLLTLVSILMVSCAKDDLRHSQDYAGIFPTFYASLGDETDADTKTYLDGKMTLRWTKGDSLSVFVGNTYNHKYKFDGETGANNGSFSAITSPEFFAAEPLDANYAVYPYNASNEMSEDGSMSIILPSVQKYAQNSFGLGANTMVAATENKQDNFLQFKNLCGYVVVKLYGEGTVTSIKLEGNDGEKISGKADVQAAFGTLPSVTMSEEATTSITLDCGDGVALGTTAETATEFWLCVPPVTFSKGFTVTATKDDGWQMIKSTSSSKEVVRNTKNALTPIEAVFDQKPDNSAALAQEREALIDFYNALDGDNWIHNENWCSDKPMNEWYGVDTDGNGFVRSLWLNSNNLAGNLPEALSAMRHLEEIHLRYNAISGGIPSWIGAITKLSCIDLDYNPLGGIIPVEIGNLIELEYLELCETELTGSIPQSIGNCKKLKVLELSWNHLSGEIPNSITDCQEMTTLYLQFNYSLTGQIPNDIGKLVKLKDMALEYNSLYGPIPESLFDLSEMTRLGLENNSLSGRIPDKFNRMPNLTQIYLRHNNFSGEIPSSLQQLEHVEALYLSNNKLYGSVPEWMTKFIVPGGGLDLINNLFSGRIPDGIINHPEWPNIWYSIAGFNNFTMDDVIIPAPDFSLTDIDGNPLDSEVEYAKHKYIIHFQWASWCGKSALLFPKIISLYEEYKDSGLDVIGACYEDISIIQDKIQEYGMPWRTYQQSNSNKIRHSEYMNFDEFYPDFDVPVITVFDCSTKMVCYCNALTDISKLEGFIREKFDDNPTEPVYVSVDYSKDGTVRTIKDHSGNLNIVFMGDGYSDRMIDDGTYDSVIDRAVDAFFMEEPFKSNKELFNIYSVNVVSTNEGISETGETALGTYYDGGTLVGGKDGRVFYYGMKAISSDDVDNTVFVVLMNQDAYAGTCYMYYPSACDYGSGAAIAYFPTSSDETTFNGLVSHEAGGHGFAKLGDEYAYEYMGAIPYGEMESTKQMEPYGWYKNVDFTSDPTQVKWSKFLSDERYANEGLGCFEGGLTYWSGVWRPTDYSIMRYNTGGFNAPSREAIWYRIHKLAYGESWQYNYEDFVEYDAINRTPAAQAASRAKVKAAAAARKGKPFQPLHEPVVIKHSWKDAVNNSGKDGR